MAAPCVQGLGMIPKMSKAMSTMLGRVRLPLLRQMGYASASTFKFSDLQVELTKKPNPKPDPDNLVFGAHFSDHMLEVPWTKTAGWGTPKISPLHNFSMHPAAKVFHYAIELFEGMKAFRGVDDKIRLFRPDKNMERMRSTAARCAFPDFDGEELQACISKLVSIDKEWVPYSTSSTLYIRPTIIGTEPTLGVSQSTEALLYVITGPVGAYYPTGIKPVTLLADPAFVRAWEGGSGAFKMGSNYAPTIYVQKEAVQRNAQQVLWLYGDDEQLTEVGTMNIFVHWVNENGENELITPPLSQGIILPGVTRRSLIEMSQEWREFKITEGIITMKQIVKALKENRLKEIFGAGTACVVSPVDNIIYRGEKLYIPTMEEKQSLWQRFLTNLQDIQFGRTSHKWAVEVE